LNEALDCNRRIKIDAKKVAAITVIAALNAIASIITVLGHKYIAQ
jgi:hypothetical protein